MADNVSVKSASGAAVSAATDELADSSQSPKVTLLAGDSSATPYRIDLAHGALTETAPASDTASSGINGRLQRIAQRITSLIALVPAALGQGTMAQGFRVVLPSDQSAIAVKGGPVTITDSSTTITTGGTAQTPIALNASRRYLHVSNPDTSRDLYFSTTGTAAVATAGSTRLGPGAAMIWEFTVPTGALSIIGAATGQPFTAKEG